MIIKKMSVYLTYNYHKWNNDTSLSVNNVLKISSIVPAQSHNIVYSYRAIEILLLSNDLATM